MSNAPRIVLFHATPVAMAPVKASMARLWPEAEPVNVLDESLSLDRARDGAELSETLTDRFLALGHHAHRAGADGILMTCSAFGPAIERLTGELPIPVVKPNEPMFRAAIAAGGEVGMLATFAPALATMEKEFTAFAQDAGVEARLETLVVPDAIERLRNGDADGHNRLVAEYAPRLSGKDVIMMAHFSMARAAEAVGRVVSTPVLSAPDSAVMAMKKLIED